MKRILFMHQASTIGGGSYCLLNVVKNIDYTIFEPVVALKTEGPLADELRKLNIEVVLFPKMSPIPYNRTLWSLSNIIAYHKADTTGNHLKQLLKNNNIDILYLNNMMLYRYLKPAREVGVKTVIHVREHWPLDEHTNQLEWARKYVYAYADKMIAINQYSASMFPKKESTIVYDWIDMDSRYEKRPLSEIFGEDMTDKKVYLYSGGVQRIKGATEVLSTFVHHVKDKNARLLVIGINPNVKSVGAKEKLKQFLSKVGIKSYFYQVAELIQADARIKCIPPTYMLAHIMQQCYCNLSYFTIPHANLALAECEIMGTPSIAADTDEAREYSMDGTLSLLFPAKNLKSFIKAIKDFDDMYDNFSKNLSFRADSIRSMFLKDANVNKLQQTLSQL